MPHEKLQMLVQEMFEDIKEVEGKELVLVVGNTGDGKSSLINYLKRSPMQKTVIKETKTLNGGRTRVIDVPAVCVVPGAMEYARIGHQVSSETLHPKAIKSDEGDYFYCDCPGFLDNRAQEEQICALLGTQIAIKFAKKVKAILLIVDFRKLGSDDRGNYLRTLVGTLSSLVGKNLDACNNAIYFVATKVDSSGVNSAVDRVTDQLYRLSDFINSQLRERPSDPDLNRQNTVLTWFIERETTNLLIADVLDQGQSRENIARVLQRPTEINKASFVYSEGKSPDRVAFDEMMLGIAAQGKKTLLDLLDKPQQISLANNKKSEEVAFIERKNKELGNLDSIVEDDGDASKQFFEEINRMNTECSNLLMEKQEESKKLELELKNKIAEQVLLVKTGEEVEKDYWVERYDEKEVYGEVKKGTVNRKKIIYSGIPFYQAHHSCHLGKFDEDKGECSAGDGRYVGVYETDADIYGTCVVSIDVQKKYKPDISTASNQAESLVKELKEKFQALGGALAGIEKDKKAGEQRKLDVLEKRAINAQQAKATLTEQITLLKSSAEERLQTADANLQLLIRQFEEAKKLFVEERSLYMMLKKICSFIAFGSAVIPEFLEAYNKLSQKFPRLFSGALDLNQINSCLSNSVAIQALPFLARNPVGTAVSMNNESRPGFFPRERGVVINPDSVLQPRDMSYTHAPT